MQKYDVDTVEQNLDFQYPDTSNGMFAELKNISQIKIDSNKSEVENIKNIIGYAHTLFTHNGDNTPSSADPLTILKEAQAGQSFRCVEYSILAAGLLWANGIPARTIRLKTSDVETRKNGAGHVVIEFWSSEYQKWIMCDVQAGVIPLNGDGLLSAYELAQKIGRDDSITYEPITGSKFLPDGNYGDKDNYSDWISEYLFYIDTPIKLALAGEDRSKQQIAMLVPLGAKNPKSFQGWFEMNAIYTHSVLDFYPKM